MIRIISYIKLTVLIGASLTLVMCSTSANNQPEEENEYMLGIKNSTPFDTTETNMTYSDITVRLIPDKKNPDFVGSTSKVKFGKLQMGKNSEFKLVPNIFALEVNGELIGDGYEFIGLDGTSMGEWPGSVWLIEIQAKYDNGNGGFVYEWHLDRLDP